MYRLQHWQDNGVFVPTSGHSIMSVKLACGFEASKVCRVIGGCLLWQMEDAYSLPCL